jgi:hypothetical protein
MSSVPEPLRTVCTDDENYTTKFHLVIDTEKVAQKGNLDKDPISVY